MQRISFSLGMLGKFQNFKLVRRSLTNNHLQDIKLAKSSSFSKVGKNLDDQSFFSLKKEPKMVLSLLLRSCSDLKLF